MSRPASKASIALAKSEDRSSDRCVALATVTVIAPRRQRARPQSTLRPSPGRSEIIAKQTACRGFGSSMRGGNTRDVSRPPRATDRVYRPLPLQLHTAGRIEHTDHPRPQTLRDLQPLVQSPVFEEFDPDRSASGRTALSLSKGCQFPLVTFHWRKRYPALTYPTCTTESRALVSRDIRSSQIMPR